MSTELQINKSKTVPKSVSRICVLMACPDSRNSFLKNTITSVEEYAGGPRVRADIGDDRFWAMDRDYDIVNIQWPESLFGKWWRLDRDRVRRLVSQITAWQDRGSKVCITRHNICPHVQSENRDYLPDVFAQVDGVIHLGRNSRHEFEQRYGKFGWHTKLLQAIVPHPGYFELENKVDRREARERLDIGQERKVILVFGGIRNRNETKFIEEVFRRVNVADKLLLVPRWYQSDSLLARIGRRSGIYHDPAPLGPDFRVGFRFVGEREIQFYMNAANVVFLPRCSRSTLNSGVLPLALTFGRIPVGPETGVIGELLADSGNPRFNDVSSAVAAVESVLNGSDSRIQEQENAAYARSELSWQIVGGKIGKFYEQLLSMNAV